MMHSFYGTLLVGLGGFLGSILRFLASGFVQQRLDSLGSFPYGTMAVNIVGSATIGLLAGAADARAILSPEARLFLLVGVLGGFTTFSTFSYETISLLRGGEVVLALGNMGLTMTLCLVAVWLGYELGYRA
jgi:CrcB protein